MKAAGLIIALLKILVSAWDLFARERDRRDQASVDQDLESDLKKIQERVKDAQAQR